MWWENANATPTNQFAPFVISRLLAYNIYGDIQTVGCKYYFKDAVGKYCGFSVQFSSVESLCCTGTV